MKGLSALHRAVLENDLSTIRKLLKTDPSLAQTTDALGFTALELAYLLKRKSAVVVLTASPKRIIKAVPKGTTTMLHLTEEKFRQQFKISYLSHLAFATYNELKTVRSNCPWTLAKSFLGEENRTQAVTYASQLSTGHCADISIRWIDEQLGYGIFAERDFPEGTYIGEFTGLVRRLSRQNPTHNPYCFHYPTRFWSWNYYAIDAQEMGNETRFINHSDNPNLTPLCLCERRLLHVVFVSNRLIEAGTQLTYDYGKDFWKKRFKIDLL